MGRNVGNKLCHNRNLAWFLSIKQRMHFIFYHITITWFFTYARHMGTTHHHKPRADRAHSLHRTVPNSPDLSPKAKLHYKLRSVQVEHSLLWQSAFFYASHKNLFMWLSPASIVALILRQSFGRHWWPPMAPGTPWLQWWSTYGGDVGRVRLAGACINSFSQAKDSDLEIGNEFRSGAFGSDMSDAWMP